MFRVKIQIDPAAREGLTALDERRRLGLAESPSTIHKHDVGGLYINISEVSETFARDRKRWFLYSQTIILEVSSSEFKAGEISESLNKFALAGQLPEWRLVELWPVDREMWLDGGVLKPRT